MIDLFAFHSVVLYFALHTPVDFNNIHQVIYVIHLHFYAILFILSHIRNETMIVMILVFEMLRGRVQFRNQNQIRIFGSGHSGHFVTGSKQWSSVLKCPFF